MPDDAKTPEERNGEWQHLVEWCLDLYKKFEASPYRKKKAEEITASVEAYEQVEKPTSDPWDGAHALPLPLTTISADNLEPRLVAGLVGKDPYVRFDTPMDPETDEVTELELWFNKELNQVVKIEPFAGHMIHKLLQDGTAFPMACYDYEETTRRDFMFLAETPPEIVEAAKIHKAQIEGAAAAGQPPPETPEELKQLEGGQVLGGVWVDKDGKPLTRDITEKTFEGGRAKLIPWDDVFVPDLLYDDDWEKTPVLHRICPTYGQLQRDSKTKAGYRNIGPWLLKEKAEKQESTGAQTDQDNATTTGKETIESICCYVAYTKRKPEDTDEDVTGWSEERQVATIAVQSKTLIRLQPLREVIYSNRHPIRRIPMFPEHGKMYGTSIFGKMKSIQKMSNEVFNLALNTAEIILIPWFFYGASTGWKGEKKILKPGMGVPVDSVKEIMFPTFPIDPSHFFAYLEFIIAFWERLFNVGDLQVGRNTDKSKTATEALAVIQEGNISHNYRSIGLKEGFLELLTVFYDLYYQNLPLDYEWTIGQKPVKIERAKMRQAKNFRLTSSTEMANKLVERREKEDLWNKVIQGHELGVGNIVEGFKELLKSSGVEDPERLMDPMVSKVVKILQQMPEVGPLFMEAVKQAVANAQQIKAGAEQKAAGGMGGNGGPQGMAAVGPVQGVPPAPGPGGGGGFARPAQVGGATA